MGPARQQRDAENAKGDIVVALGRDNAQQVEARTFSKHKELEPLRDRSTEGAAIRDKSVLLRPPAFRCEIRDAERVPLEKRGTWQ